MKIACPIPVYGRKPLVELTVRRLKESGVIPIIVGDEEFVKEIAEKYSVEFVHHPNKPLGSKWNAGFVASKKYDPDGVIFMGSSDWVSDSYLKEIKTLLEDYSFIGKLDCHFVDVSEEIRLLHWAGYNCNRRGEPIGIGRVLRKDFLEKINWKPFEDHIDNGLDFSMWKKVLDHKEKTMILPVKTNEIELLSISTNKWINKHVFNHHWNGQKELNTKLTLDYLDKFTRDIKELWKPVELKTKIKQCYVSQSVNDFDWQTNLGLRDYYDSLEPCLFFGVYSERDMAAVVNHNSLAVVFWCGMDVKYQSRFKQVKKPNIFHISPHKNVLKELYKHGIEGTLVPGNFLDETEFNGKYGKKIFAYCPETASDYHDIKTIKKLQSLGYDIIIGDGKIPQKEWHEGKKYEIYDQCYIGLVLNKFAGGRATIDELGSLGKMCITNVTDGPNTLPFKKFDQIISHLKNYENVEPNINIANTYKKTKLGPRWVYTEYYLK